MFTFKFKHSGYGCGGKRGDLGRGGAEENRRQAQLRRSVIIVSNTANYTF